MSEVIKKTEDADRFREDDLVRADIEAAADGVMSGFPWDQTKEGAEYWVIVYKLLLEIAKIAEGFEQPSEGDQEAGED